MIKTPCSRPLFISSIGGPWLNLPIFALTALALFSTPFQMLRGLSFIDSPTNALISLGIMMGLLLTTYRYRKTLSEHFLKSLDLLGRTPVWTLLLLGVGLRLIWILIYPAQPGSDGATYLALAERLKNGETYFVSGTYAYWPPGFPIFLAPWIWIFDAPIFSYLIANIFLFVVGFFGLILLGGTVGTASAGRIAAALFAIWPNLIFSSGTPEKELLVLALLPWATSFIFQSAQRQNGYLQTLGAGLIFGAVTLVQPSLQFLPLVAAALLLMTVKAWRRALTYCALVFFWGGVDCGPLDISQLPDIRKLYLGRDEWRIKFVSVE